MLHPDVTPPLLYLLIMNHQEQEQAMDTEKEINYHCKMRQFCGRTTPTLFIVSIRNVTKQKQ